MPIPLDVQMATAALICELIKSGQPRAARDMWQQLLRETCPYTPNVDAVCKITRYWLAMGEVQRAAEVFSVLNGIVYNDKTFLYTQHELADAMEADRINTSVYPFETAMFRRWVPPVQHFHGKKYWSWSPGRLLSVTDRVYMVMCPPEHAAATTSFYLSEWLHVYGAPPPIQEEIDKGWYFYYITFRSGRRKIVKQNDPVAFVRLKEDEEVL